MKTHPSLVPTCIAVACLSLVGCATPTSGTDRKSTAVPAALDFKQNNAYQRTTGNIDAKRPTPPTETRITSGPSVPPMIAGNLRPPQPPVQPATQAAGDLTVSFEQMALPAFIQAVYGGILKINHAIDPAVSARTELVTFRTPQPLTALKLQEVAGQLLKSYGIAVQDFGGVVRIVPQANVSSTLPLIRRGRAQPTVPLPLRPIFHYIETEAIRPQNILPTIKSMLTNKVTIEADTSGGLLISGQPDDVQVALELIQVFDQPSTRGQNNARITPRFWGADEFTRRLAEVLKAEGYAVGTQSGTGEPITLIAMPPINSVIAFSTSKEVLQHVLSWVKELDQMSTVQSGSAFFTYPVRHADAQELAKSLNELISGTSAPATPTPSTGGTPVAAPQSATSRQKRVVVNNATNSLIFQGGSQEDYRQWLTLLTELDRPVKSALLDVMVAEVALNDNNDQGFSWQLDQLGAGASAVKLSGTSYKVGLSGSGIALNALLGGNPLRQLAISALASNSDSRVISNPKLMTRNGESASISVGQDVPTVTSQAVASTATNGFGATSTNVVPQTIQYRNTGVLLRVRPVIHAGDRIDLDINQEVSSAELTTTGVTSSPTIRKRSVETKLSLRDGATVMLGGLISETNTDSDSGVPILKDIPGLGNFFKKSGRSRARTELVVLITPYIINDSNEAEAATDAYQTSLGDWAQGVRDRVAANRKAMAKRAESLPQPPQGLAPAPNQTLPATAPQPAPQTASPITPQPPAAQPTPEQSPVRPTPPLPTEPAAPTPAPVQPSAERMINLVNPTGISNSSSGGSDSTASGMPGNPVATETPSQPTGKPAPTKIQGMNVPAGATIVEDPELLREILKATGR
jgi:general secretion pathway protein D